MVLGRSGLPIDPPFSPSIKRASGVQVPSNKRAITVQYPGSFGVKSPPARFKPSLKGVLLRPFGEERWVYGLVVQRIE
jgi:hypothetical protein